MRDSDESSGLHKRRETRQGISFVEACAEPFRIFFPCAVIVGLIGVALWPLHFAGVVSFYPGTSHARLMGHGFFGGFILGFLGTAVPRMLSTHPLIPREVIILIGLYIVTSAAHAFGQTAIGDVAMLALLAVFAGLMAVRFLKRNDLPPPGFVMVLMAFASVSLGILLTLGMPDDSEGVSAFRLALPRLLLYQGFVLLPILGVGAFLLPRFLGLESSHDLPESKTPSRIWARNAVIAGVAGILVFGSFLIEAGGWYRSGHTLRFLIVLLYLLYHVPAHRSVPEGGALAIVLRTAFLLVLSGFILVAIFPVYRVALLHLTLVGGFAMITVTVATRVVFGHSGKRALLRKQNRWFTISTVLMLIGMATRVSGDFWPKILVSHFNYGVLLWASGFLLWALYVIPLVLIPDRD